MAWATFNRDTLAQFAMMATRHSARLMRDKVGLEVEVLLSGPEGGDAQIAARGDGRGGRGVLLRRSADRAAARIRISVRSCASCSVHNVRWPPTWPRPISSSPRSPMRPAGDGPRRPADPFPARLRVTYNPRGDVGLRRGQLLLPQGRARDGPVRARRANARHALPRGQGRSLDHPRQRRARTFIGYRVQRQQPRPDEGRPALPPHGGHGRGAGSGLADDLEDRGGQLALRRRKGGIAVDPKTLAPREL